MDTILTVTMNPTIDKTTHVDRVAPGQKLRCAAPRHDPGGGGINVSRAVGKLGGEATAVYPAGGPMGAVLENRLNEEDVARIQIPIAGWTRENVTVLDDSGEQHYRFNMPGPELSESDWRRCLDRVREFRPLPDYVVASGSLPPGVPDDFYGRLVRLGREWDARVVVDTSGDALRAAAREGLYLLKPNMRELGQLAGGPIEDEEQQEEAATELVRSGQAEVVVVSLGAAGALLVTEDRCERLRAPVVNIRSKIGAGDSMVAGMVLALSGGWDLVEAVRYGIASGAAAVMTPGTELCRKEDTERLYERISNRAREPRS